MYQANSYVSLTYIGWKWNERLTPVSSSTLLHVEPLQQSRLLMQVWPSATQEEGPHLPWIYKKETVGVMKLSGKRTHPKSIIIFASKTSTALRIVVKLTDFPDRITRTLSGGQHDTCEGSSSGGKRGENVEDFHGWYRYQKSLMKTFLLNVGSSE